jgi:hypothetical protein
MLIGRYTETNLDMRISTLQPVTDVTMYLFILGRKTEDLYISKLLTPWI